MTTYAADANFLIMHNGDILAPGVRIGSGSPITALIIDSDATVRIAGTTWSAGIAAFASSANVTVQGSGSITSLGATGLYQADGTVTNRGQISGIQAVDLSGSLFNFGGIYGGDTGVTFRGGTITNAGIIDGNSAVFSGGDTTIVNTGMIYADAFNSIQMSYGALTLTNSGTIRGDIFAADSSDLITNIGTIIGGISLGVGNDVYQGTGQVTGTISGDEGNDTLTGGVYNDAFNGGNDNDTLDGGRGADTLTGGNGDDTFYVDTTGDRVFEGNSGGADTVYTSVSYTLRAGQEIENLSVNPDADYADLAINLTGNEYANTLTGNDATNRLNGKAGADTMIGGDGDDIYYVDNVGDVVVETANHGNDTVYTTVDHTLSANVETLRAQGTGDLALTGNATANTITGNAGANLIDGSAGADRMVGGDGDDIYYVDNLGDTVVEGLVGGIDSVQAGVSFTLGYYVENLTLTGAAAIDRTGNVNANTITGNGAANTIGGRGGLDTLTGNGGADTFVFASRLDAGVNNSTITDFAHGTDHIALDDRFFRFIGTGGTLDEQFFTTAAPTTGAQHIIYDAATGVLSHDLDGVGSRPAIAFAQVTIGTVLDHNDFLIV
jgi:Ca2+-binding RTX toxin-like protein